MTKNVKLLSLIGIAAALAGGSVAISNNNNSTVQAASITLPAGYTKSAIIRVTAKLDSQFLVDDPAD